MAERGAKVSEALCAYALGLRFQDLPGSVVGRAKDLFLDFLACAFGGHEVAESTRPIRDGVASLRHGARGTATVLGEPDLYPPQYAALLNGAFGHSMDYDDIHRDAVIHPGVTIFPAVLALGEDRGASGAEFLAAAIVGYDVANKIGKAHRTFVHARGFHPTATTGIFGCTAAGARLLGLSLEQTTNAFGMNVSQAAGSLQFEANGAWDKRIHTGLAAHNAILSLFLARQGYRGSTEPIEGRHGYFALYASQPLDASVALAGLGTDFEVMNTAVKPYPCCRCSHSTIDAVTGLVREHGLGPGDIASIDIRISPYSHKIVGDPPEAKRQPVNLVEAQFSLYFAAAAAAWGDFTWESYRLIGDAEIRALMQRITVRPEDGVPQYGVKIGLALHDGRCFAKDLPLPKGEPELPLAREEFARKFREWAERVLGAANTDRALALVDALDAVPDIRALTSHLRAIREPAERSVRRVAARD